jgi:hypothetical protein
MREETVSREEADIREIIRTSFKGCEELNDYVEAARLLVVNEQKKNKQLQTLLHQIGETAALARIYKNKLS